MAQLLVFFATSKCSPSVIGTVLNRHLNVRTLLYCMCQKKYVTLKHVSKQQLQLSFCPQLPPPKNKNVYIYFSGKEVVKAEEHEQ